jgi:acetyl-CoA C-acetyltransferase
LCPLCDQLVGQTSETLATEYAIGREEQDRYALESNRRAARAWSEGRFASEVIPVTVGEGKRAATVERDEHFRGNAALEDMAKLKPVFRQDGTITAGNASAITDGAAAIIVLSEAAADRHGVTPHAGLRGRSSHRGHPAHGHGPCRRSAPARAASPHARGGRRHRVERAFIAGARVRSRAHFDRERLNPNGGGIALGRPTGCSGARIVVPLLAQLERVKGRYGLATLCVSGGQGMAVLFERV